MKSWENYMIVVIVVSMGVWGCLVYGNPTQEKIIPPALTFMISSNTVSNFTPCGCHSGKWGGMPRRGTIFLDVEESLDWPTLYVDTGDVSQGSTSETQKAKDEYIFMTYEVMDYDAVAVGYGELGLGYDELARVGEAYDIPWVGANIYAPETFPDLPVANPPDATTEVVTPDTSAETSGDEITTPEPLFAPYVVVEPEGYPGYKVGIIGMMMQDAGRLNPKRETFSFEPYQNAIDISVEKLRVTEKVDLIVLLCDNDNFQNMDPEQVFSDIDIVIGGRGTLQRAENSTFNELNPLYRENVEPPWLADAADTDESSSEDEEVYDALSHFEPLSTPIMVPKGQSRGRLVRRFDIFINPTGEIYDYFTEEIRVDDTRADDPRMDAVARMYDSEILSTELMARVERNFAGSAACETCHPGYLAAWEDHGHFNSYDTIAESDSITDRECTRCHAIGFIEEPRLLTYDLITDTHKNIGCEACHTNGRRHITLQTQLANLSDEAREQATTSDIMETDIQQTHCLECHKDEWAEGFDFDAAMETAGEICLSIHPSYVPPESSDQ